MTQSIERIGKEAALAIHSAAIARFGGLDGVRDEGLLESALAQPFQTFDGEELYPTVAQKAARYAYGIASNHPFADGNKRTATAIMGAFLRMKGWSMLRYSEFEPRPFYETIQGAMHTVRAFFCIVSHMSLEILPSTR